MRSRLTALPILLLALLLVGCANTTRRLAVVGYQASQTGHALQTAAEQAHAQGLLSAPDYQNFLAANDRFADAGLAYSRALLAYIAAKDADSAGNLRAALNALLAALEALPSSVTDAVFKAKVSAEADKAAPVLAEGRSALPQ